MPYWLLSVLWGIGLTALAGWGMTRLLRQLGALSHEASLLFGALFALLFINSNIHIVFAYAFPAFAVWTMEAVDTGLSRIDRLFRCLGLLFLSLLSFPVLTLPHYPIFHFFLVLFFGFRRADFTRQVMAVFIVWTAYVLFFAPSIVSLYQYIPYAQRDWNFPTVTALQASISFMQAFKGRLVELAVFPLIIPSLYLLRKSRSGLIAFLFVLVPLVVSCIFGSEMKNFLANTFIVKMDLFLSSMLAGCASFIFAALGFDALRKEPKARFLCLALALASIFLRKGEYALLSGFFTVLAASSLFELTRGGDRTRQRQLVILAVLAASLSGIGMMTRQQYMSAGTFLPQASFERHHILKDFAAESRNDPFRVGCLDIHPAVVQAYGLDTVGGKSPLFNKYYKQYVQGAVAPQLASEELQNGFTNVWRQIYLTRSKADHDQRPLVLPGPERSTKDFNMPMLERLGVRYLVSARPLRDTENIADLVAMDDLDIFIPRFLRSTEIGRSFKQPLWVYRLRHAKPLGSIAAAQAVSGDNAALQGLMASPGAPGAHSAFLDARDMPPRPESALGAADGQTPSGQVTLSSWTPDVLVFTGSVDAPALLRVANNYDPRWVATYNGQPAAVIRADHAFQAVPLPKAGNFKVMLEYRSPVIWWLHMASLAGCLLLLTCLAPSRRDGMLSPVSATPRLPLRFPVHSVLAGSAMAVVWSLGFSLFIMRKISPDSSNLLTMTYAMLTIPLLGPCIGGWTAFFVRRTAEHNVEAPPVSSENNAQG
jgi:general stress protein CsbA